MKVQAFSKSHTDMLIRPVATEYLFAQITAERNGGLAASLTLYDNPYISYHGKRTVLFGDLDLPENNVDACQALFQKAEEEVRKAGKEYLLGPMNGSTWHEYRLPLQGNAPMFSGDCLTPASWVEILQNAGYDQADDYHSSIAVIGAYSEPRVPVHVVIRPITPESLSNDLHLLYPLCLQAFARAPYFSPISEEAFIAQYEAARPLLEAGLSNIALCEEKAVAFLLAYPDQLNRDETIVVAKTVARHPEARIPGLVKSLADVLYNTAGSKGYTHAVHAFMHDANQSVQRSEEFGGTLLRSYALFAKSLNPDE